jgi:hypothetical protein
MARMASLLGAAPRSPLIFLTISESHLYLTPENTTLGHTHTHTQPKEEEHHIFAMTLSLNGTHEDYIFPLPTGHPFSFTRSIFIQVTLRYTQPQLPCTTLTPLTPRPILMATISRLGLGTASAQRADYQVLILAYLLDNAFMHA